MVFSVLMSLPAAINLDNMILLLEIVLDAKMMDILSRMESVYKILILCQVVPPDKLLVLVHALMLRSTVNSITWLLEIAINVFLDSSRTSVESATLETIIPDVQVMRSAFKDTVSKNQQIADLLIIWVYVLLAMVININSKMVNVLRLRDVEMDNTLTHLDHVSMHLLVAAMEASTLILEFV